MNLRAFLSELQRRKVVRVGLYAPLREDARFAGLVARIGLRSHSLSAGGVTSEFVQ